MALVIEDGTGLSTAEAYISVADADTYHANFTGSSSWTSSTPTTAIKERVLRRGAQVLDDTYILRWKGDRTNKIQALDWPRDSVEDTDGFIVDSATVPVEIQRANAELSLREITETDGVAPDVANDGVIKRKKSKVGPLEQDITYQGGKALLPKFTIVDLLLKGLLESSSIIERS